jgi:hypothetical protein
VAKARGGVTGGGCGDVGGSANPRSYVGAVERGSHRSLLGAGAYSPPLDAVLRRRCSGRGVETEEEAGVGAVRAEVATQQRVWQVLQQARLGRCQQLERDNVQTAARYALEWQEKRETGCLPLLRLPVHATSPLLRLRVTRRSDKLLAAGAAIGNGNRSL